ncbi:hypothetical protein HMPREF1579_01360 [Gardnerella vaginalis JCP8066]|nr:hypothetical protein HMPREF1579_01360 [Gardnerella vaginalis JCP8066]
MIGYFAGGCMLGSPTWRGEENCRKWQKSSPAFIRCVLFVTFS